VDHGGISEDHWLFSRLLRLPIPIVIIGTLSCFSFPLIPIVTTVEIIFAELFLETTIFEAFHVFIIYGPERSPD